MVQIIPLKISKYFQENRPRPYSPPAMTQCYKDTFFFTVLKLNFRMGCIISLIDYKYFKLDKFH